jgi:cytochrome c biogenesis protein CcdA/thiol-disulfide isomerase/thioredoxin
MIILLFFAFLAGIVTILSPCILPVLPIVLSGTLTGGKRRPLAIVIGFILSFTFFTLFLSIIVRATGLPTDTLRFVAILIIGVFGISLLIPKFQQWTEKLFSTIAIAPRATSGLLIGMSLGLVWAPCVGPILASVIALSLTDTVTSTTFFITLAYSMGTAIPMLIILYSGRRLVQKIPNPLLLQKLFGVLMISIAIAMYLNLDRKFQTYILTVFPTYGTGLTKIETIPIVTNALQSIQNKQAAIGNAPDFVGGQQWFNSAPLTMSQLRGKVIMVDFWTYTCINCIRTLPYTKAWWNKYKDKGFVLVGVHTPEFEFEKDAGNVGKAIKDFGITYPVVQDNNYAIWNAYGNQYWPADYLIDKTGKIVDTHFGEGDYDATEKKIQELLGISMPVNNPTYQVNTQTPETYLGTNRGDYSQISTTGTWNKSPEYAAPLQGATLTFPFDATDVYLVMRPKIEGTPGKVEVYLDGKLTTTVTVDSDKLYPLIQLPSEGQHVLLLKFLDSNLELYAFTFG